MTNRPSRPGLPDDPGSRNFQSVLGRTRSYGLVQRDPERPVEGWTWLRADLSPPELRVVLDGVTYKVDFVAV